jgi:hypothetical protein
MASELQGMVSYKVVNNNKVLDSGAYYGKYDGNNLDVIGRDKNNIVYVKLSNADIMDLLSIPSSQERLEERIYKDFYTKSRKKSKKHKKTKKHSTKPRMKKTRKKSLKSTKTQKHMHKTTQHYHTPTVRKTPGHHKK